jgi:pyruvate formate lyase activating enzyme
LLRIGGIQKTSLIDFPNEISSVIFTLGCNLRCPYCHNWNLLYQEHTIPLKEIYEVLLERKKYIDAICITGGEPTLNKDLPEFLKKIKNYGFKVKLDTNGCFPENLIKCLPYLDYIAMDVKTSHAKYKELGATRPDNILKSINIIMDNSIKYEFRCTAYPEFVDEKTIKKIGKLVNGANFFAIQQYSPDHVLNNEKKINPYKKSQLIRLSKIIQEYVKDVEVRA